MQKERMLKTFCVRQNLMTMPRSKTAHHHDLWMAMLHPVATWKMEKSMNWMI